MQQLQLIENYNQQISFDKYPNGFYLNPKIKSTDFFNSILNSQSKKLQLAQCIPFNLKNKFMATEATQAIRVLNDTLLVWEKNHFYKIPLNLKSIQRIKNEKRAISKLSHTRLKKYLPNNIYLEKYVKSPLMKLVKTNEIQLLDDLIFEYHHIAENSKVMHGDFHINQIYKYNQDIKIIDWDMMQEGSAKIDVCSFFAHFIGFYKMNNYFKALNTLIFQMDDFILLAKNIGFEKSAPLMQKSHLGDFLQQRSDWCTKNDADPKFTENLKEIISQYENR